jgi:hypothetical protein
MNVEDINFQYDLDISYDYDYNCADYNCDEEGICRCGIIENVEVKSVDMSKVVKDIYDFYFGPDNILKAREDKLKKILYGTDKEFDLYTIDRIVRKYKIYDSENWDVKTMNGYYGEEIDEINITTNIANRINKELEIAFSIDELNLRVEYLLQLEYGKLLPELENCKYEITKIDKNDIIFASKNHYDKVKKKDLTHYNEKRYNGIRGIVIEKDNKLRVIDGYHRIHCAEGPSVKVLKIIK